MKIQRRLHLLRTYVARRIHRHGFGVQSPWAYELVRDVLYEPRAYYAYDDLHLTTDSDRQLWRLRNHFRHEQLHYFGPADAEVFSKYNDIASVADAHTYVIIDGISTTHYALWQTILKDPRATVTFDMGHRALITFDNKRIKQNYIL